MTGRELRVDLKWDAARRHERAERDKHIAEDIALADRLAQALAGDAAEEDSLETPADSRPEPRSRSRIRRSSVGWLRKNP